MAKVKRRATLPETEAEELAGYIEHLRPQDLGKGRPGPGHRGRRSLSARGVGHSPSIHVRLPEPLYRRLRRGAGRLGTTVSEVVREILEEHAPKSR